jgi:hypothetical protein
VNGLVKFKDSLEIHFLISSGLELANPLKDLQKCDVVKRPLGCNLLSVDVIRQIAYLHICYRP